MKDENVIENLKKYNQTRTLKILENVDETIKNKIIEQLKDINFPQLKKIFHNPIDFLLYYLLLYELQKNARFLLVFQ